MDVRAFIAMQMSLAYIGAEVHIPELTQPTIRHSIIILSIW